MANNHKNFREQSKKIYYFIKESGDSIAIVAAIVAAMFLVDSIERLAGTRLLEVSPGN